MDPEAPPLESESAALRIQSIADGLRRELATVVFGQDQAIDLLLTALLSEGHILLEGRPGTAKTTLVKCLAALLDLDFKRIQLTPDMLPAEITGSSVYDLNTRTFSFRQGPVFTDLLLADEINRTPPKTQSALLEAMEERQVTADGGRLPLPSLFTVIATLNPVEFEGTFPLPEAQLDRFMMKIPVGYPSEEAEKRMLASFSERFGRHFPHRETLRPIAGRADIDECRRGLGKIRVTEEMQDYILRLVRETRRHPDIELGCSPRCALSLLAASRAFAALRGESFVTPDDVKAVALPVMSHRLLLTADAELDDLTTDQAVRQVLTQVPVPR